MDSETTSQLVHQLVCCHCNITLPPVMWNNMNDNPIIDYCLHVWVIGFSFISHYSGLCYVPMAHPIPCWFASWLAVALSLTSNLLYFSKSPRLQLVPKIWCCNLGCYFHCYTSLTVLHVKIHLVMRQKPRWFLKLPFEVPKLIFKNPLNLSYLWPYRETIFFVVKF